MKDEKIVAKQLTDMIYKSFGSHTGFLFGLSPEQKPNVTAIVVSTLRCLEQLDIIKDEYI